MFGDMLKLFESNTFLEGALKQSKKMHTKTMSMVEDSWIAISKGDQKLAESVLERDDEIDELDVKIRKNVLAYLSSMPTGGNVELSLILIDISTALEKIADHAQWIAETSTHIPALEKDDYTKKLGRMHKLVLEIGKEVKTAFGKSDKKKAKSAIAKVDTVKRLHREIVEDLRRDKRISAEKAIAIWSVTTNLKRMAAYSKNIALTVTGPYHRAK